MTLRPSCRLVIAIPTGIWVHSRFQDWFGLVFDSRAGMSSVSVLGPVWVHDRLQNPFGLPNGSSAGIGSGSGPGHRNVTKISSLTSKGKVSVSGPGWVWY